MYLELHRLQSQKTLQSALYNNLKYSLNAIFEEILN